LFFSACTIFNKSCFYKTEVLFYLFLCLLWCFSLISNQDSFRVSTILFTSLYVISYIAYMKCLALNKFSSENYIFFIRSIIIAYFIVLLVQQVCVLIDLPILNVSNYQVDTPWKLNSLSVEPSHASRIIGILMISHLFITEKMRGEKFTLMTYLRTDSVLTVALLWILLTNGSGTAFLILSLFIFRFLSIRNSVVFLLLIIIGAISVSGHESQAFERFFEFFKSALTMDKQQMIIADHSASVRVVPFLIAFDKLSLFSLNGFIGNGVDFTKGFMSLEFPGVKDDFTGGGMLSFALEYGWPLCLLFLYLTFKKMVILNEPVTIILWFIMVMLSGINTSLLWFSMFILSTTKYFYNNSYD
ncbi:hypothetical protein, partial [Photobacterium indicum]|uniref:hypothetical protein n=1 Tax=Photobacterium indicum TaxID=81447 RepID=UPI003D103810